MGIRTQEQIEEALAEATAQNVDAQDNGSQVPGLTYEEGVFAALNWVAGNSDDDPTDL